MEFWLNVYGLLPENQDQWNEPLSRVKKAFRLLPIQTIPWKRNGFNKT